MTIPATTKKMQRLGSFFRCRRGVVAIEFGLIAGPLMIMLLGLFQFALFCLEGQRLANALYDLPAYKGSQLTADQYQIASLVCSNLSLVEDCVNTVKVQLAPLSDYSEVAVPIDTVVVPGSSGTLMLLRVEAPMISLLPLLGNLPLRASTLYVQS